MPQRGPCHQRMFARWFRRNQQRFLVPVELRRASARREEVVFPMHPDCLDVCLWKGNLSVWITWKSECVVCILDLDVAAIKTHKGYQCLLAIKPRDIWPTLDALYEADLFEPFLRCVNDRLRHACTVHIHGTLKVSTWVEFVDQVDTSPELDNLLVRIPFPGARPYLLVPRRGV